MEGQLAKLAGRIERLHHEMATAAADYERLVALQDEVAGLTAEHDDLETRWLVLADRLDDSTVQ